MFKLRDKLAALYPVDVTVKHRFGQRCHAQGEFVLRVIARNLSGSGKFQRGGIAKTSMAKKIVYVMRAKNAGQIPPVGNGRAGYAVLPRLDCAGVFVDGRGKILQQNFAAVFLTPGIPDISAQDGRMRLREIFLSDIHVDGHSISPPDSVAMSLHNYSKRIIKASAFCW